MAKADVNKPVENGLETHPSRHQRLIALRESPMNIHRAEVTMLLTILESVPLVVLIRIVIQWDHRKNDA
jgi:hypothetical protein